MTNPTYFPTVITANCTGLLADGNGLIVYAVCTGTPPTTANVFESGATIIQTDAAATAPDSYINTGSSASPVWTYV